MNPPADDKIFSTLLLIGGYDCDQQIPDLNIFGGARITGNLCVGGNVTIMGNLDVNGNIYCVEGGNCEPIIGSGYKYQLHRSIVTSDNVETRIDSYFPGPPNGQNWSGTLPTYLHIFTGPTGLGISYHTLALAASQNGDYGCFVAEVNPSDLNANPVTTGSVIGELLPTDDPSLAYNFIVGNLVPTISPSIWYYYQSAPSTTTELYDIKIVEN